MESGHLLYGTARIYITTAIFVKFLDENIQKTKYLPVLYFLKFKVLLDSQELGPGWTCTAPRHRQREQRFALYTIIDVQHHGTLSLCQGKQR